MILRKISDLVDHQPCSLVTVITTLAAVNDYFFFFFVWPQVSWKCSYSVLPPPQCMCKDYCIMFHIGLYWRQDP